MFEANRLSLAALCVASVLTGCVAPRNVVALQKLKLDGEPYYVEDRRHECACHEVGWFGWEYHCRSTLWNVSRTAGSPQERLQALDQEITRIGFERIEEDWARKKENDDWVLLYKHPRGSGAMIFAEHADPDGMLATWPPRRDRTTLEGEYVYGVKASYSSPWDWLVERWRNATWVFRECKGYHFTGDPRPRSQRR
ncbi:MAG: hypothetical protein E6K81_16470 [Candidatus Eisenbacteria bacterium]|uniref:Lipoprotein n=1 Tax=Eiseniibacteriota bacterium TaxID=2212470 RepID=A0A538TYM6_UNCEI|nr:MAG: hypothetical protein E6K81_16470 [Candidatus Eisenbacteria bacterium]